MKSKKQQNSASSQKRSKDVQDALNEISKESSRDSSASSSTPKRFVRHKKVALKAGLLVASLVVIGVLVLVFSIWSAFNRISDKSNNSATALLDGNIQPGELRGEGDGRVNVLFIGIGGKNHDGGQLADTVMVASLDPVNNRLAMLSLPRDLRVSLPNGGIGKLNAVHAYGELQGKGPQALKDTVGEILDLPIHYYIRADFDGFKKFVDEIGGIDINVPKEIYDPNFPDRQMIGYEPFHIRAGQQKLNGDVALKYARSRYSTSDFDRADRQQQLLLAIREKALSVGVLANPARVLSIINILGDHVRMDMSAREVSALVSLARQLDTSQTSNVVLDNAANGPLRSMNLGAYYLVPKAGDWSEVRKIAHEIFKDPYIEKENAKIEIHNGSGIDGEAGRLRNELSRLGYNVGNVETAEGVDETVIYDYSNGKAEFSLSYLSQRLNSRVVKSSRDSSVDEDVDIRIVIGKNYKRD